MNSSEQRLAKKPRVEKAATGDDMLPADLLECIANRLLSEDVGNYIRFRAVCQQWRLSTKNPRDFPAASHRHRDWIMMISDVSKDAGIRRFVNLSTGERRAIALPGLDVCSILSVADGLLVLCHKVTAAVHVLNPFTRAVAHLPSLDSVGPPWHVWTGAVSSSEDRPLVTLYFSSLDLLASARPGDSRWRFMQTPRYARTLFFDGKLYGVSQREGALLIEVCDPEDPSGDAATVIASFGWLLAYPLDNRTRNLYLVESEGEMLLVRCSLNFLNDGIIFAILTPTAPLLEIFKVDLRQKKLVPTNGVIGRNRALFLGGRRSVSVHSDAFAEIQNGKIYIYPLHFTAQLHSFVPGLVGELIEYCEYRTW